MIIVQAVAGVTIQSLTVVNAGGDQGIQALIGGSNTVLQGLTFDDTVGTSFAAHAVQLAGNDPTVRNCVFDMTNSNLAECVDLSAGMGATISDNEVRGAAGGFPTHFVQNTSGAAYNQLQVLNNTGNAAGEFIGGAVAADTYTNSIIADNVFTLTNGNGIDLGNAPNNVQVLRNTYTYRGGAAGVGLLEAGGSNNTYSDNRITCAALGVGGDDAIQFGSSNALISGNTLDATTGDAGIDAAIAAATNATITDNTILGAGAGDGIDISNPANSNFTISGNSISNTFGAGIDNGGGGTNHTISDNNLVNVGARGIDSAGNNTIDGNTINGAPLNDGIRTGVNDQVLDNEISSVAGGGHGINVNAGNAFVDGNTVRNVSGGGNGVNLAAVADNSVISNNEVDNVSGGGDGIFFVAGSDNQIIDGNTITNIHTGGRGIDVATGLNSVVSNNTIDGTSQSGIRVTTGDNNTISGNTAANAARDSVTFVAEFAGILLQGANANNNVVDGNTITNAGSTTYAVGIDVLGAGSDNNDIINNTVSGFTTVINASTATSIGIRVRHGLNCKVEGNTVSNSGNMRVGIDALAPDDLPVKGNTIEGMIDIGLRLRGGTVNNQLEVEGNTLNDNVTGISMEAGGAEITNVNKICGGAIALYVGTLANSSGFKVNGNCIGAPILVRNVGLGNLDATGNYWTCTAVSGTNVFGSVDVSNPLSSCPAGFDCDCPCDGSGGTTGEFCCTYPHGWNLISMSAVPDNPNAATIFDALPLYDYDACTGTYGTPIVVSSTEGYWLYLTLEQEFCIDGTVPLTDQTIVLPCAGWHLIGTSFDAYWLNTVVTCGGQTSNISQAGDWILLPVFSYDAVAHGYDAVTWLVPCLGYWVYTLVDNVTLTIPFAQPPVPTSIPLSTMALPEGLTPPPPPSLDGFFDQVEEELVFTNAPNPVTDVHTTTFMVKGAMSGLAEEVKVQVFDLSGKLIYEDQQSGTTLNWHTENSAGEYLANGVYLYRMSVLVNGRWVTSEVKKLAVMR